MQTIILDLQAEVDQLNQHNSTLQSQVSELQIGKVEMTKEISKLKNDLMQTKSDLDKTLPKEKFVGIMTEYGHKLKLRDDEIKILKEQLVSMTIKSKTKTINDSKSDPSENELKAKELISM